MTINELIYFRAVCKNKSIRKAAQQLFITPQGLGKAISSLEKELDCQLLLRTSRGIEVTACGQAVYKYSKEILGDVNSMRSEIDKLLNRQDQEPLYIAAANGVIRAIGAERILQFKSNHPRMEIRAKTLADYEVEDAVYRGDVQIGLTLGPVDREKFEADLIKSFKLMLVVNSRNPLAKQESLSYKDIKNERIILVEDVFKAHHTFVDNCRQAGFEPNIIMGINELAHGHKYVGQNLGISYSVDFALEEIDNAKVKAIPLTDGNNDWSIYLITKKGEKLSDTAKIFKTFFLKSLIKSRENG